MKILLTTVCFLVIFLVTPASGQQSSENVSDAEWAYHKKDYAKAFAMFTAAEKELSRAVTGFSGEAYDFAEAARKKFNNFKTKDATKEQLQYSSDRRDLRSTCFHLGRLYSRGQGVARDQRAGFGWTLKAAQMGNTDACSETARSYFDGVGVAKSYKDAFLWINTAVSRATVQSRDGATLSKISFYDHALGVLNPLAAAGDAAAQFHLGLIYVDASLRGDEVSEIDVGKIDVSGIEVSGLEVWHKYNPAEAYKWFGRSAALNYEPAMMAVARNHAGNKEHGRAFQWYLKAANGGSARAQAAVADSYYSGSGVAKDVAKGDEWQVKSIMKDGPKLFDFATKVADGKRPTGQVVKPNFKQAFDLFMISAKLHHGRSQRALSSLYVTGRGVQKDLNQARQWLWHAANNGDTDSQYMVGTIFDSGNDMFTGKKFPRQGAEAFKWYRKAAKGGRAPRDKHYYRGDQRAFFVVGVCYFLGNGVKKDVAKSKSWMKKAIDTGVAVESAKGIPAQAQAFWDRHLK